MYSSQTEHNYFLFRLSCLTTLKEKCTVRIGEVSSSESM